MPTPRAPAHPPPDTEPQDARGRLVRSMALEAMAALRAVQHLAQRAFEPLGLSPAQVLTLVMIHKGIDQPKLLAQQLETVQSAVSALLGELQGRGLVDRAPDPADRRRVRLQVTHAGEAMLARAAQQWLVATEHRLAGIQLADLEATARVVRQLTQGGGP